MVDCSVFGVDLSKNVFHLVQMSKGGRMLKREKLSRERFEERLQGLPSGVELYMEACGGAHYWSRVAEGLDLKVRQIAPHRVKPYVGHQKNDYRDAEAICEASQRKGMKFVTTKSSFQQEVEGLHRIRERRIGFRTALINQIRGLLSEHGVVLPIGTTAFYSYRSLFLDDSRLSPALKVTIGELFEELLHLDERIVLTERSLEHLSKENDTIKRLKTIPGVGAITASAIGSLYGDPKVFKNGRQFSASIGLVPKQHSTGGKQRLGGITKHGDGYVRRLLIIGGLSTLRATLRSKAPDNKRSLWIKRLYAEKGAKLTAVAIANKNARIAWKILTSSATFHMEKPATTADIQ
jgi:transposase